MDVLKVQNINFLNALQNHQEGEVAFCEDEQQYMIYKNNEWLPIQATMTDSGLQLNFYDLNKQIISQLPPFDEVRINDAKDTLSAWAKSSVYMLYGREINYFTVFQKIDEGEFETLVDAVFECLASISDKIYAFDIVEEGAIEIWLDYENETTVLYLFDYTEGVVTYGR